MLIISYLIIASIVFSVFFTKFWKDETTPKNDRISWIALMISAVLWPLVVPLSLWELASKKHKTEQIAQAVPEEEEKEEIIKRDRYNTPPFSNPAIKPSKSE